MRQRPRLTKHFGVLLLIALLLAGAVFTIVNHMGNSRVLTAQDTRIAELEDDVTHAQMLAEEAVAENVHAALGLSTQRLDDDEKILREALSIALRWNSGREYDEARQRLLERYDLAEDSAFFTEFMPPAKIITEPDGSTRYVFDERKMTSSPGQRFEVSVMRVRGTVYHYAITTDVVFTADPAAYGVQPGTEHRQPPRESRQLFVTAAIDGDGQIIELNADSAVDAGRTSG